MKEKVLQKKYIIQAQKASKIDTKFYESANSLFNFMGELDFIKKLLARWLYFQDIIRKMLVISI